MAPPDGSAYFQFSQRMAPRTTVRSGPFNETFDAVQAGFAQLPLPADIQGGAPNYGLDSGTANHYAIACPFPIPGLFEGLTIDFHALNANTGGAADVNQDGLGIIALKRRDGSDPLAGDIIVGPNRIQYDGTLWKIQGSSQADAAAASASAAAAAASAAASAASAVTAAAYAAALSGTSTDSRTVGTGARTFATQSAKQWVAGQRIRVATPDGVNGMDGNVTSYVGTSLQFTADYTFGSGTFTSWVISLSGPVGPTGPAGSPGAGTGDMLKANNLSELVNKDTSLTNLGGTTAGTALFKGTNAAAQRTSLGLGTAAQNATGDFQAADAELAAIAGLVSAADRLPYFTGSGTAALATFTATARTLLACASTAAMLAALGITSGTVAVSGQAKNLLGSRTATTIISYSADEIILKDSSGNPTVERLGNAAGAVQSSAATSGPCGAGPDGLAGSNAFNYVYAIRKTAPLVAAVVTADATSDKLTIFTTLPLDATPVVVAGSVLPGGITAGQIYYTKNRDVPGSAFQLATTPGGSVVNITSSGTAVTVTELPAVMVTGAYPSPTLPSGYTFFALIAVLYMTASTTFRDFSQRGKHVAFPVQTALTATAVTTPGTLQSLDISAIVPPIAIECSGSAGEDAASPTSNSITLAANAAGHGQVDIISQSYSSTVSPEGLKKGGHFAIPLTPASPAVLFWTSNAAGAVNGIYISGFDLP